MRRSFVCSLAKEPNKQTRSALSPTSRELGIATTVDLRSSSASIRPFRLRASTPPGTRLTFASRFASHLIACLSLANLVVFRAPLVRGSELGVRAPATKEVLAISIGTRRLSPRRAGLKIYTCSARDCGLAPASSPRHRRPLPLRLARQTPDGRRLLAHPLGACSSRADSIVCAAMCPLGGAQQVPRGCAAQAGPRQADDATRRPSACVWLGALVLSPLVQAPMSPASLAQLCRPIASGVERRYR